MNGRPRFTIDINQDLSLRLYRAFPYGTRRRIMECLLAQVADLVDKGGESVLGKIMDGRITLQEKREEKRDE